MNAHFDPLYGALTDMQRWVPSPAHIMRRAALLEAFSHFPPGRLLDAGCGAGRLLVDWDRLGHSGWGIDLDPHARDLAKTCVSDFGAAFDISEMPPPPEAEQFDYLAIIEVLEHLEEPAAALQEWLAYLKDGGMMIASVPAFSRLWDKSDEWAGHVQRFEPEAFTRLIEDSGLTVISYQLYGFPLANLTRVAGNISSALKMCQRGNHISREEATKASGRDRSTESMLKSLLLSKPLASLLRLGISLQRHYSRKQRGIGIILVAKKEAKSQGKAKAQKKDTK